MFVIASSLRDSLDLQNTEFHKCNSFYNLAEINRREE